MSQEEPKPNQPTPDITADPAGPDAGGTAHKNPLLRRFTVAAPGAEIERDIERLAGEASKKVKVPGFRQGKVPVDVVRRLHREALQDEAAHAAVNRLVRERIRQEGLTIAGQPALEKLDYQEGRDLQAEIAVEVLPDIRLPDLASLEVEIPADALKGEPFEEAQQIERVLDANKRSVPVKERPVQEEDLVLVKLQNKVLDSGRLTPRKDVYVMMKKEMDVEVAGLHEELLGKRIGDSVTFRRKYAADFRKKAWAGKAVEHHAEVTAIYEWKRPELDGEFLKTLGMSDLDELKKRLAEEHRHQLQHRRDEVTLEHALRKLAESTDFPLPGTLVLQEMNRRLSENRQGLAFPDDAARDGFMRSLRAAAEHSVRVSLILDRVRETQRITVSGEDLDKEYQHLAEHNRVSEKEVRRYFTDPQKLDELKDKLLDGKVLDFVRQAVRVREV